MSVCGKFVSCACNPTTGALDWNQDEDLIAYAASVYLFIYAPRAVSAPLPPRVIGSCYGHKGRINCVRWMRQWDEQGITSSFTREVLTGSSDNSIIVWKIEVNDDGSSHGVPIQVIKGAKDTITSISCATYADGSSIAVATSGDQNTYIYRRSGEESGDGFSLLQTLSTPHHYFLTTALAILPQSSSVVLACGGDDMKVHLYTQISAASQFQFQDALLGHEDWVQGLDFGHDTNGSLLLASASQDCMIRLWKIVPKVEDSNDVGDEDEKILSKLLHTSEREFSAGDQEKFVVSLDALLYGHENKIFDVKWSRQTSTLQPLRLLSASFDKTMVVWNQDESGVWADSVRVGNVGGNTLGFFGCCFGPNNKHIIAHAHQGTLHEWSYNESNDQWEPKVTVGGHFKSVYELTWSVGGDYMLSVGADQTTRLFSQWKSSPNCGDDPSWHEMARPQVHGYDMRCVATISDGKFVSGADEKVLRTFDAPSSFFNSFTKLTGVTLEAGNTEGQALVASVPALGLSNKAVFGDDLAKLKAQKEEEDNVNGVPSFRSTGDVVYPVSVDVFEHPPLEEHLTQNSLWPETRKLYGHGYELICVACNHAQTLLASACKASKEKHAQLRLWDLATGLELGSLEGHALTVVRICFSPDDEWMISTSRDRALCIYHREENGELPYKLVAKKEKAHDRIIWDACWSPDGKFFATASRDKRVKLWTFSLEQGLEEVAMLPKFKESVTSMDLCAAESKFLVLALGFDNGDVRVLISELSDEEGKIETSWNEVIALPKDLAHAATVRSVKWRKKIVHSAKEPLELASCGMDQLVRINAVSLQL
eukprot:m.15465 g.15465  ORF g.15465 m.15465 type:complete len:823 (+) comp4482_c0_seq1:89-2557(+)